MTAAAPPPRPELAQRQASDPAVSAWVDASAGTGKTKVLTDRVLRLMLGGTPPDKVLCITFTKAAAAEMAIRINNTLAGWATIGDGDLEAALFELQGARPDGDLQRRARQLFARVLDAPGGMKIQTIHALCQSLLRRFPLEAGLPPHFDLMDDRTAAELLDDVWQTMLRTPSAAVADALAQVTGQVAEDAFAALIGELARERGRLARLLADHGGLGGLIDAVRAQLDLSPGDDDASVVAADCRDDAVDGPALRRAVTALLEGSRTDMARGEAVAAWLDDPAGRAASIDAYADAYLTKTGEIRARLITARPAAAHPGAAEALAMEAQRLAALVDRRKAVKVAAATAALSTVGATLIDAYAAAKRRRALLDYDDLIFETAALLRRPGIAPWVLYKLDGGIDHVLIDEAQDTNPEQWQVIAALSEEFFAGQGATDADRTIFAVGDEKQSIFSFQRADPAAFDAMRAHFAGRIAGARKTLRPVTLNVSFRSTAAVLTVVDAVFAGAAARDGVAPSPDAAIEHAPFRVGDGGLVELWPPVGPEEADDVAPWSPPVDQGGRSDPASRLANRIAATVADWIGSGEVLEARGRAIHAGDVLVLVRKRDRFFLELVRALKGRGIDVAGVDRMVLTRQLAAMDLMALAQFLLLPEDDLTLATVLKGPLIGLGEQQLFELAYRRDGHLWPALGRAAGGDPAFRAARDYLGGLLARVDFIAPYGLFAAVLATPCPADEVSGRRAILGRLGDEAADPMDEFLALALAFEQGQPPSLQRFVHWTAAGEAEIKREMEQGGRRRVRIMTVHGAKGLQAPIVVLPDTMAAPSMSPAILWPDDHMAVPLWAPRRALEDARCNAARERANRRRDREYRRLLYVALTRAEDRLYICGHHGRHAPSDGCWYELCRDAVASLDGVERIATPGGDDSVLRYRIPQTRPAEVGAAEPPSRVVDPLPAWARRPPPSEPEPAQPLTPSRPVGEEPPVRAPLGADDGARFRRGRLVHALLQTLPDLAPAARPAAARRFLAQPAHRLAPPAQAEIANETLAVLDDPAFAVLFGAHSRAEVPVVGALAGYTLSGQIDRLAVTDAEVLIVDYKTNRPPPETSDQVPVVYLAQMAAYRAALRRIYPRRPVRCALLWTDGPRLMPLADGLLDRHSP